MNITKDTTDANGIRNATLQTTATGNDDEGYKAAERQEVKIWIEGAECLVPRQGTQERRLKLQDKTRATDPLLAEMVEAFPGYLDPAGEFGGDEWATFNWEWMGEDEVVKCWMSHLPIEVLPLIKEQTVGIVQRHSVNGVDSGEWIDYSFHLRAPYAFSVLKNAGMIPANAVLMNDSDQPLSYDDEQEAA